MFEVLEEVALEQFAFDQLLLEDGWGQLLEVGREEVGEVLLLFVQSDIGLQQHHHEDGLLLAVPHLPVLLKLRTRQSIRNERLNNLPDMLLVLIVTAARKILQGPARNQPP